MFDVLVVGAGPTGSYTAWKLADKGYQVGVLERHSAPGLKSCCTGIISTECRRLLEIKEGAILRRVNSAVLFPPSGLPIKLQRAETQAYILDRSAFDAGIAELAVSRGAEYSFQTAVLDLQVTPDKVAVRAFCCSRETVFEARALVIAAGFNSSLTQLAGLGSTMDFAAGAQMEVESHAQEVEVYFGSQFAPGFFAWMVPASPGKVRVGLLSRHNPTLYLKRLLSSLIEKGKVAGTNGSIAHGVVPLSPLSKTFAHRVLVVGDAAGQVKPTTGGGIYYGLLAAGMAAETLAEALDCGDLSAGKLSIFERRWRQKMGRELKIGRWARKIFETMDDRTINRVFEYVRSSGLDRALLESEVSFDWHSGASLDIMRRFLSLKISDPIKKLTGGSTKTRI